MRDAAAVESHGVHREIDRLSGPKRQLHHPAGPLGRIARKVVEHEVTQAVDDRHAANHLDRLRDVRVAADHRCSTRVDHLPGEAGLRGSRLGSVFRPPVDEGHNGVGASPRRADVFQHLLFLERRGAGPVGGGGRGQGPKAVGAQHRHLETVPLEHERLPCLCQRAACAERSDPSLVENPHLLDQPSGAEVAAVIVSQRDGGKVFFQEPRRVGGGSKRERLEHPLATFSQHAFEIAHAVVGIGQELAAGRKGVTAGGDRMARAAVEHDVADEHDRHAGGRGRRLRGVVGSDGMRDRDAEPEAEQPEWIADELPTTERHENDSHAWPPS